MNITVREATRADAIALKDRLREEDLAEVVATDGSAEKALIESFERSCDCFCVDIDGNQAALFGIVPQSLLGETAVVWFLGAPEMKRIKKSFVRASREMIARFLLQFPVLCNVVDSRYVSSIAWLKSCGAQFSDTPIKFGGIDFYGFVIRRAT